LSPEDIHASYGELSVRRWCRYVRQGCEDLHDEVWSGRPPTGFLDIQILALLDGQSFHSAYSNAEALCVSSSTILSHLRESLGMKIFHLPWVPQELAINLRQTWMETWS
jgi:hypothetical protein